MATRIAIAVVRWGDLFLVGQRPEGVALAGYWEFPGGKVETQETPAAAAVRECREESGLDVQVTSELARIDHTYDHGPVELHFFLCAPLNPQQPPRSPFCWLPRTQLANLQFPDANRPVLEAL